MAKPKYVMLVAYVDKRGECSLSMACAAVKELSDLPPAVVECWGEAGHLLWQALPKSKVKAAASALTALKVRVIGVTDVVPANA